MTSEPEGAEHSTNVDAERNTLIPDNFYALQLGEVETDVGTFALTVRELGKLVVTSGAVEASDPFTMFGAGARFHVESGRYDVRATMADVSDERDGSHLREAYLSLIVSEAESRFLLHTCAYVGVDSGTVAFADADATTRCMPDFDLHYDEVFENGSDTSWVALLENPQHIAEGAANIELPFAQAGENVVLSYAGWGDGVYPVFASYDENEELTGLHIDLGVVSQNQPLCAHDGECSRVQEPSVAAAAADPAATDADADAPTPLPPHLGYALRSPHYVMRLVRYSLARYWLTLAGLVVAGIALFVSSELLWPNIVANFDGSPGDVASTKTWMQIAGVAIVVLTLPLSALLALSQPILRDRRIDLSYAPYLRRLAEENGLRFRGKHAEAHDPNFVPAMSGLNGTKPHFLAAAAGIVQSVPTSVALHQRWAGRGSLNRGLRTTLVYSAEFAEQLPHTVIVARDAPGSAFISAFERVYDDEQRVSLQSDLDNYFLLYTHRRTVTDALAYWSPPLLLRLREFGSAVSVETIGRRVYLYVDASVVKNEQYLDRVLTLFAALVRAGARATRVEFLQLPNAQKYPYLRSRESGGLVQIAGKNAPKIYVAVAAILGWGVWRYYLALGWTTEFWILSGATVAVLGAVVVVAVRARSSYTKRADKRGY